MKQYQAYQFLLPGWGTHYPTHCIMHQCRRQTRKGYRKHYLHFTGSEERHKKTKKNTESDLCTGLSWGYDAKP